MIFSKSTYNKVNLYSMIVVPLLLILFSIIGIAEYRKSEREMGEKISRLFEQAIHEEIMFQMKNERMSVRKTSNPSVAGESIQNRTIITEDTIITKEAEAERDFNKSLLKNSQTYLLHQNRLQADTLRKIFDAKLEENNLKVRSVVVMRHEDKIETSGDTTQYRFNYRIPVVKGGVFGEITYEGLICYSSFTVFRLMPKNTKRILILLSGLEIFMLGVIIFLFIDKWKIKANKIMKRGKYYFIGETIFDIQKKELTGQKRKVVKVAKMPADMLLIFLESEDYMVRKEELKEIFWPKIDTANQSLMSSINKLRNFLKEAGCAFSITTKRGDDHYVLKYVQEDTEAFFGK